jgi:hypothetical protein
MTKSQRTTALAAVLLLATAGIAAANSPRVQNACVGDARRLCPNQKLGSAEMRYCMEANATRLSRTCVKALEDDGIVPRGMLRR